MAGEDMKHSRSAMDERTGGTRPDERAERRGRGTVRVRRAETQVWQEAPRRNGVETQAIKF